MAESYHHPYKPYGIQLELMNKIHELLDSNKGNDAKKVGLFESPTGTGKTLSLICSTVSWLRKNKERVLTSVGEQNSLLEKQSADVSADDDDDDDPDWITESYNKNKIHDTLQQFYTFEKDIEKYNLKLDKPDKLKAQTSHSYKKRKIEHVNVEVDNAVESEYEQFLLPDYNTDDSHIHNQVQYLLNKYDQSNKSNDLPTGAVLKQPMRIIFASRTHSQLQQFASQLNLPHFPSSFSSMPVEVVKFLPLGSRKQLCCNPKILKKNSLDLINEGCQDAVKTSTCEYYKPQTSILKSYPKEAIFDKVNDIEDIQLKGADVFHTCPYYASRMATNYAEIISVPYQLLLMNNSRSSINLDLQNSIIIVDEAHNLIDTILNMNKCKISNAELLIIIQSLKNYLKRFNKKLNSQNRLNLLKLLKFLNFISEYITKNYKKNMEINPNSILQYGNLDVYNFNELVAFIRDSKLAYKLQSYMNKETQDDTRTEKKPQGQPLLFKIINFIECLRNPSYEGVFHFTQEHNHLEYMLLEPKDFFKPIVENCYKLILCGGTMEPMAEFTEKLFPYLHENQILKFSCNHVIPDSNLEVFTVSNGFENKNIEYEFTFDKKNDPKMLVSLANTLLSIFENTPMGVVVFVQSYQYLESLIQFWKSKSLQFNQMNSAKTIFYEKGGNVGPDPWKQYSDNILVNNIPSCLFAVVGGKLSEGINFQDSLARAVVLLGLPYPNILSSDMVIQRNHIFKKDPVKGREIFKKYIDMICMRSVNQSVGRAIRHIDDYAIIYLIDKRFGNKNVQDNLSAWVKKRIMPSNENVIEETKRFFKNKEKN